MGWQKRNCSCKFYLLERRLLEKKYQSFSGGVHALKPSQLITDYVRTATKVDRIQKPGSLSRALREMKIREDYEMKWSEIKSYEMCMAWIDTKVFESRLSSLNNDHKLPQFMQQI